MGPVLGLLRSCPVLTLVMARLAAVVRVVRAVMLAVVRAPVVPGAAMWTSPFSVGHGGHLSSRNLTIATGSRVTRSNIFHISALRARPFSEMHVPEAYAASW